MLLLRMLIFTKINNSLTMLCGLSWRLFVISPKRREPVLLQGIRYIQNTYRQRNAELPWIVAAFSDTEGRLAETVSSVKADLVLTHKTFHIIIQPQSW